MFLNQGEKDAYVAVINDSPFFTRSTHDHGPDRGDSRTGCVPDQKEKNNDEQQKKVRS